MYPRFKFPYTDFNKINLDWILGHLRDILDRLGILWEKPHNYALDGADLLERFSSMEEIHEAIRAGDFTKIFVGDYIPILVQGEFTDRASGRTITIDESHRLEIAAINPYIRSGPSGVDPIPNHVILCSRDCIGEKIQMAPNTVGYYTPDAPNPWYASALYQTLNADTDSVLSILRTTPIAPYIYNGPTGEGQYVWWANLAYGDAPPPVSASNHGRGVLFLPTETEVFGAQFFMRDRYSIGSILCQWDLFKGSMAHIVKNLGPTGDPIQWWTSTFTTSTRFAANTPTGNLGDRAVDNTGTSFPICLMMI